VTAQAFWTAFLATAGVVAALGLGLVLGFWVSVAWLAVDQAGYHRKRRRRSDRIG